jgi:hypothetical protein
MSEPFHPARPSPPGRRRSGDVAEPEQLASVIALAARDEASWVAVAVRVDNGNPPPGERGGARFPP